MERGPELVRGMRIKGVVVQVVSGRLRLVQAFAAINDKAVRHSLLALTEGMARLTAAQKSFLGALLAGPDGTPRPVDEREEAGHAITVLLARRGVWGVRVHDVRGTRDVLRVLERMEVQE